MKFADLIKQALEQKGLPVRRLKDAAKSLGVSVELLRTILTKSQSTEKAATPAGFEIPLKGEAR